MPSFAVNGLDDSALERAAKQAGLALRIDELRRIATTLGRDPTLVEVHAFDVQWSEHCSYKSSRKHLKKLPSSGADVVVGPGEDAGIVRLGEFDGETYCVVAAHESHNHPSQVVPFEGAATGVGGIVRDVLCMGAEVIALADCLRFGDVSNPASHQRYVARSVVDGVAAYGNAIGVPNIAGDVYFHEGFNDNCLVNVIALGLVKEKDIIHSRAPENSAGWDIVLVGKATDASGFGGASFASLTLDAEQAEANKAAVQVPDPFLENVIMRASYRVFEYLREHKITAGFKDLGAGGIMGCSAELCGSGGFGAIIDLDDVNMAVDDLPPHVVAVGETQERMCWVLPPEVTADVLRIYNEEFSLPEIAFNARATVIGVVSDDKRYVMRHGAEIVMDVPVEFLTGSIEDDLALAATRRDQATDLVPRGFESVETILSDLAICSREPLYREYDSVVRGTTVLPRGGANAGVIAPIEGCPFGIALGVAGNPLLSSGGAEFAALQTVREAFRNVVAAGARPIALTDCLNFGNPRDPQQYAEFVGAVEGLAAAANALNLPFISGNVSLYNESVRGSIPASAIVACIGFIQDVALVVTPALKEPGSTIMFVHDFPGVHERLLEAMREKAVKSCFAIGWGGLQVAGARMAFAAQQEGRPLQISFDLPKEALQIVEGFLVEVESANEFFAHFGVPWAVPAGQVHDASDLDRLQRAWTKPLEEVYA